MALIDLVSDLSNFKGQTNPQSIDDQIKKGVDFFPNTDAPGFTPKTDLESLYHKVREGTVAPEGGDVDPYANLNPFENRKSVWRTNSGKYRFMRRGTNPPSVAYNDSIFYRPFPGGVGGQTTLYDIDGYTINAQPGGFSINNPQYPNAVGNTLLPEPNLFDFTAFRDRTRDVYQGHYLNSPFANIPLPGLFSPNYDVETKDLWQDGSIHIFTGDTQEPIGGRVSQFANLLIGDQRTSQFSSPERVNATNIYTLPEGFSGTQTTLSLPKESFRYSTSDTTDTFQSSFYVSNIVGPKRKEKIDELQEFKLGTFTNVPSGLNEQNNFGTKSYRAVADPHNFDLFRQPFILREYGNQWGLDGTPGGYFSDILGGFVRGAPGITGLIDRNITDKFRIGKFLLTSNGIGFIAKQFALQALNPTIESKFWNPLSALNIPMGVLNELPENFGAGLVTLLAGIALPISHTERHIGGGRYEDVLELTGTTNGEPDGRLYYYARAFAPKTDVPEVKTGFSLFDNYANNQLDGQQGGLYFTRANPNKYAFPISSAPKSVVDGVPSFIAGPLEAKRDFENIKDKEGGTFNPKTAVNEDGGAILRHYTLAYDKIPSPNDNPSEDPDEEYGYMQKDYRVVSPSENYALIHDSEEKPSSITLETRRRSVNITRAIGIHKHYDKNDTDRFGRTDDVLGNIRGDAKSDNVDRVNITPYGSSDENGAEPLAAVNDYIRFRFYDMVNKKWIIFRAILEGISDSITPEYGEEKYIGRPDKVYVYQGADRNVSFTFSIFPKTKQELPVLMEKLNYLVGLCYPSYTPEERMISPLISLTLGNLFVGVTGLLWSLNVTVEDISTWELDDKLQFPHYIKAACEFKYIGDNVLASKGKHYGIDWIPDGSSADRYGLGDLGFNNYPGRKSLDANGKPQEFRKLFHELHQP